MDERAWRKRLNVFRLKKPDEPEDVLARIRERARPKELEPFNPFLGEQDFWLDGFCEDCGNFEHLTFLDGLYLCYRCMASFHLPSM